MAAPISIELPDTYTDRLWRTMPVLVLMLSLFMTVLAWAMIYRSIRGAEEQRFHNSLNLLANQITDRLKSYERLMAAASGFVSASDDVTPEEWRAFVAIQGMDEFPAASGIGLVVRVPNKEVAAFSTAMRKSFPEYSVQNRGHGPVHYFIKYMEPLNINRSVLGMDATMDNNRHEVFDRACDLAESTMSGRFSLKQFPNDGPGAVYVYPIYLHGVIPATVELRRAQLTGWITLPMRLNLLLNSVADEWHDQLDFEIFQGTQLSSETLLYDPDEDAMLGQMNFNSPEYRARVFQTTRTLEIGGQKWTLAVANRPTFFSNSDHHYATYTAIWGSGVSMLLTSLVYGLGRSRQRARILAHKMTLRYQASDEQYRVLVDNVRDAAAFLLDPRGKIATWNMGATRFFGFKSRAAIGQSLELILSAEDITARVHDSKLTEAAAQGSISFEGRRFRADGSTFWGCSFITALREADGRLRGFSLLTRDISELKAHEVARAKAARQLELQNEELTKARDLAIASVRAKTDFLANMSHEIRTPMTSILSFTDLLLENTTLLPAADISAGALRSIRKNGDHLLAIINDILDISKIDAGQISLHSVEISPLAALEEIVSLMNVRAVEKKLELRTDIRFPLPATIRTDPVRLRQILVNLVGNAIKFTDTGSVTLRLSFLPKDSVLLFEVSDTGIGIDPTNHEHIFTPFAQVDTSPSRRFGGTGLGLHISRRLAHILGGEIQLHSVLQNGATFTFRLPVPAGNSPISFIDFAPIPPPPPAPATLPVTGTDALHGHILLAEDGAEIQRLFSYLLARSGATVDIASNGQEALDAVRSMLKGGPAIDLILMDMQMPIMDGYAATRAIRALGVTLPIVALTAHAMSGDRQACLAVGCTDYMSKPIDHPRLIALCQRYLPQRPQN